MNQNLFLQARTAQGDQAAPKTNDQLRAEIRENVRQQLEAAAQATRVRTHVGPIAPLPPNVDGPATYVGVQSQPFDPNGIPPQAVDISIAFFLTVAAIIIGLPLARAFARRMDRRGGTAHIPPEVTTQLTQLSQAVDAIALEVERISEGQRFTTRLLTEERDAARQALPTPAGR